MFYLWKEDKCSADGEKEGVCSPRTVPTHLLLFTSEEMDTRWMRGCWPGDKNHRSSKLETGRNVGNAPIKTVFPTWTQYTRAQLPLWKPKTPQHYFISQSTNTLCSNADGIGFRWDGRRCLQTLQILCTLIERFSRAIWLMLSCAMYSLFAPV